MKEHGMEPRTLATMTPGQRRTYMNLIGKATRSIMTKDASFMVLVSGGGCTTIVTDRNRVEWAAVLEAAAAELRRQAAVPNN